MNKTNKTFSLRMKGRYEMYFHTTVVDDMMITFLSLKLSQNKCRGLVKFYQKGINSDSVILKRITNF